MNYVTRIYNLRTGTTKEQKMLRRRDAVTIGQLDMLSDEIVLSGNRFSGALPSELGQLLGRTRYGGTP